MIDVFVKVYAPNVLRLGMAITAIERWRMEEEKGHCRLLLLGARGSLSLPYKNHSFDKLFDLDTFHVESKRYAEQHAESEVYVVADDDQLIVTRDFLQVGLEFFARWPDVGMMAGLMITGEVRDRGIAAWDSDSIGCPYFVRKGILTDIPDGDLSNFDTRLTEYVRSKGYKTGFLGTARYNHLGYGYSEVGKARGMEAAWQA
jgi:hypothetical protein